MRVKTFLVMTKSKLNKYKADEEMKDAENDKSEKVEEEHVNEEQKARFEQAGSARANVVIPEPAVPNPSSSLILLSTEYGNQFLNVSSDTSLVVILKDPTEIEIQSMVGVFIHQEDFVVLRTPLIDIVISMVTEKTTPTPKQTPPTTKAQHSGSFQEHQKHLDLYNALIGLISLDEAIKKESKPLKYNQAGLSKKGNTPSKSSKTDKYVNTDKTVEETVKEVAMDVKELVNDEIEPPQDDASPKQDKSTWFEQPPKPETPDLEWKYTISLTKTKAAGYDLKGIKDMIPKLWSTVKEAYDKNAALGIYHWRPK
nr:hypothetical protein [Tanacetum cinerariifolium]